MYFKCKYYLFYIKEMHIAFGAGDEVCNDLYFMGALLDSSSKNLSPCINMFYLVDCSNVTEECSGLL